MYIVSAVTHVASLFFILDLSVVSTVVLVRNHSASGCEGYRVGFRALVCDAFESP